MGIKITSSHRDHRHAATFSARRLAPWLALGVLIVAALIVALATMATRRNLADERERAFVATYNRSSALEQYLTATLDKAQLALHSVHVDLESDMHRFASREFGRRLSKLRAMVPQVESLRVADARGLVIFGGPAGAASVSVADRDYFIRLRDDPRARFVTSGPLLSRFGHNWIIVLAHRLNGADGSFAGVVFASLRSAELLRPFADMKRGTDDATAIYTTDLKLVGCYIEPQGVCREIGDAKASDELRAAVSANPLAGSYVATVPLDGVERVNAYRKVRGYPFYVVSGIATANYFAAAREDAIEIWEFAGLALVLTLAVGALIYYSWRCQNRSAEAIARESRRYEMLLRTAGDGIYVVDGAGTVLEANEAFCQLLGYAREDLMRMNSVRWNAKWSEAKARALLAAGFASSDAAIFETRYRHADGHLIECEINAAIGEFDGRKALYASVRDISWHKQTEFALRESESQLRRVIDGSSQGFWELNLRTYAYTVSPRSEIMLGYAPGEEHISFENLGNWVEAEDLARARESIERHVAGKSNRHEIEVRVRAKSGEWRWILTSGRIVEWDAEGRPLIMAGTHTDVSERRRNDVALVEAMAEVAQANQAKSRFLAAASHDLRQPLAALSLYLGALKPKVGPDNRDLMVNIQECVDSLSALLTDLLDVNKLDAGVIVPAPRDFLVDDLLKPIAALHDAEARLKGLRFRLRCGCGVARTDPVLLRRIVVNLIVNAIRYTERGGVLVSCRRQLGKRWIEVWDTGVGIAEDQTRIIFEPFTQLGDDARSHGSGLGLAIADKMAKLLGLELRLHSRPGRGSMFAIELPEGGAAPTSPVSEERRVTNPLRIAIVEDNPHVMRALELVLQSAGHQVAAASNGQQLIGKIGRRRPDIIIADYRLAGAETGFDVIESVRNIFGDDLPALLVTGDTDPALIRSMADRGIAVRYKPLQLDPLLAFIREAMEARGTVNTPGDRQVTDH
jgi:PAS domain S-box-containing protein